MAKILLIEPYKVLQQAISLFLFPDHEVQVQTDEVSKDSLADRELVIVDAAALREAGRLSPQLLSALEGARAKVFWLEEAGGSSPVKAEHWVVLKKPLQRETFQSALTRAFSPVGNQREDKGASEPSRRKDHTGGKPTEKKESGDSGQTSLEFIELTEVVEQQPSAKKEKRAPGKSK